MVFKVQISIKHFPVARNNLLELRKRTNQKQVIGSSVIERIALSLHNIGIVFVLFATNIWLFMIARISILFRPIASAPRGYLHCVDNLVRQNLFTVKTVATNTLKFSLPRVTKFSPPPKTMKLDTPEFHALFTPEMKELINIFEQYNYELRIAGGAVRDLLMKIKPHDVDFASNATPDQMKEMFTKENIRMFNTKGESHGTVSVRINDKENFEITTLRIDVVTDGRHAKVEFTKDWYLDANRRDLTINSLFLGFDGTVYDFFNGIEDLDNKRIRFVGNAVARIREDYLRILRYFRFYGRIAQEPYKHDTEILETIQANVNGLSGIAGERLWTELKKILVGNFKFEIMKTMVDVGIAPHVGLHGKLNMDELAALRERATDFELHPITIIASLLGNEADMLAFNERIKLSTFERELGYFIIRNRDDKPCEDSLQPYQALVITTTAKEADVRVWVEQVLSYRGDRKLLAEFKSWKVPKFPVNGHHLMDRGIIGGKRFQYIMSAMKKRWLSSSFTLTEEDLLANFDEIVQEVDEQYPNTNKGKKRNKKRS